MGLEAEDGRLSFVLDPASPSSSLAEAMMVASTSVPVLTIIAPALS